MLSQAQLSEFEQDMNRIRDEVLSDLGKKDSHHILTMIRIQRGLEILSRIMILLGFLHPILWVLGAITLGISKILENMEIGHNVIHGQYDWMNDPYIHSKQFEWDIVSDSASWKRTHNFEHHTYTNILGKDRDYGYDTLRLTHEQRWTWPRLFQILYYLVLSLFFQWGVALHELNYREIKDGHKSWKDKLPFIKGMATKAPPQALKDYVFFPLLSGPFFLQALAANIAANVIRNIWSSQIIFCGHFPEGVQTFSKEECENESKGHWYYRQMLGSANIKGGRLMHIMNGHLSFQIEHHLFPDVPAHRYAEMSIHVQALAKKYGIPYNTGGFFSQLSTVIAKVIQYSFPPPKGYISNTKMVAD